MHHSPMNVNMMRPGDNAAVLVKVLAQGKLESLDGVGHLRRSNRQQDVAGLSWLSEASSALHVLKRRPAFPTMCLHAQPPWPRRCRTP